jgi:hypothetical protein
MSASTRELALDDEAPCKRLLPGRIPRAGERSVPTAIAGIEEGLDCLTEDFARNRQAELLEAVPAERVEIVHGG